MTSIVIGVAGSIGSGKSTVSSAMASALRCPVASFGDYVRGVATQQGRDRSRGTLQALSDQLLDSRGARGLTRDLIAASSWDRLSSLVVDGVRHTDVVSAIRREVSPTPFSLVFLTVPQATRLERIAARDGLSAEELSSLEEHPTERAVETELEALADLSISSIHSVDDTVSMILDQLSIDRAE